VLQIELTACYGSYSQGERHGDTFPRAQYRPVHFLLVE